MDVLPDPAVAAHGDDARAEVVGELADAIDLGWNDEEGALGVPGQPRGAFGVE